MFLMESMNLTLFLVVSIDKLYVIFEAVAYLIMDSHCYRRLTEPGTCRTAKHIVRHWWDTVLGNGKTTRPGVRRTKPGVNDTAFS